MPGHQGQTLLRPDNLSREFVAVGVEDTVAQALEKIRVAPAGPGDVFYCYACDPEGRLVGVVPVRKLLRAAPEDRISTVMFTRIVKLPADAPDSLVEDFFATYRFLAFPVVDKDGRIVGVIEVKDIVDKFSEALFDDVEGRVRDEVFRFVGLPQDELAVRSPLKMAWRRFPWLLVNIAGGFLAATTSRFFEHALERIVVVAAFIPMILVLSESLGVQVTAVSSSMISEGSVDRRALRREVYGTAIAGVLAASVVAVLGRVYYPGFAFPAALFLAISISTLFAAAIGAVLPVAFRRFKIDPHLASAPLVLAASDNVTLVIYFSLVALLVP